jgi:hypothetical protein
MDGGEGLGIILGSFVYFFTIIGRILKKKASLKASQFLTVDLGNPHCHRHGWSSNEMPKGSVPKGRFKKSNPKKESIFNQNRSNKPFLRLFLNGNGA